MKILLSNDDGYLAPGLAALRRALDPLAEIVVVAPEQNHSGASNALTLDRPLRVQQLEKANRAARGTPGVVRGSAPRRPDDARSAAT